MDVERLRLIHRMIHQTQVIRRWITDVEDLTSLAWGDDIDAAALMLLREDGGWCMRRQLVALELCLGRETALAFRPEGRLRHHMELPGEG